MTYFYDSAEVKRKEISPGVSIRTISGEKLMMNLVEIAPEAVEPLHAHPNEQTGMVIQKRFDFTIGGNTKRMKVGDSYVIPGGVQHEAKGRDGWAMAVDIFSPPREDYK